jgi:prephenate dehydrogenase
MNCAIIGLGLMGGSMALALRETGIFSEIVGYDQNEHHQTLASELNLIDSIISKNDILTYDVIILAIPVEGIITFIHSFEAIPDSTLIIDLGSTKYNIISSIPKEYRHNFVAAHPMAGTEFFGPQAALPDLYKNKVMVLCDIVDSGTSQRELAEKLIYEIGMNIVYLDAQEHDDHAAYISHLPHIMSFSLANTVLKQEDPESILTLMAGGFRDMSRLAKSNPTMWSDIFRQNSHNVLSSIENLEFELQKAKAFIKEEKWDDMHRWMSKGQEIIDLSKHVQVEGKDER